VPKTDEDIARRKFLKDNEHDHEIDESGYNSEHSKISYDEDDIEPSFFGTIAGSTFSAAVVGGLIGTVIFPGIGTAIGAGVGALVGLVAGFIIYRSILPTYSQENPAESRDNIEEEQSDSEEREKADLFINNQKKFNTSIDSNPSTSVRSENHITEHKPSGSPKKP